MAKGKALQWVALLVVAVVLFGGGLLLGAWWVSRPPAEADATESQSAVADRGRDGGGPVAPLPGGEGGGEAIAPPELRKVYELEFCAHLSQDRAEEEAAQLEAIGYAPQIVEVRNSEGRSLYSVRAGEYLTLEAAAAAATEFRESRDRDGLSPVVRRRMKIVGGGDDPRPAV